MPSTSVQAAVDEWLDHGLPGCSARTVQLYLDGIRPLTDRIGARPLERAIRHAEADDLVGRNVAALVRPPEGRQGRPSKALTVDQAQALVNAAGCGADFGTSGDSAGGCRIGCTHMLCCS